MHWEKRKEKKIKKELILKTKINLLHKNKGKTKWFLY